LTALPPRILGHSTRPKNTANNNDNNKKGLRYAKTDLDRRRSFSDDQHFCSEAASGIEPLYRVLQNPDSEDEDPS